MNRKITVISLSALFIFASCADNTTDPNVSEESFFATEVQPILTTHCVSCHGGTNGVTLSSYASIMSSTGSDLGKTVIAGDADNSPLVQVLEGTANGIVRMPQGGAALSESQINSIRAWINDGAKNE
ncbi:hypothetical protein EP331_05825 [bacterium]|nr:MAG: hypothetical protein EP331_05825 [bacterium]